MNDHRKTYQRVRNILQANYTAAKPIRAAITGIGRLHIDRQLPFLCLYRRCDNNSDPGTEKLIHTEASFLICSQKEGWDDVALPLIHDIMDLMIKRFGSALLLEIWSDIEAEDAPADDLPVPRFKVFTQSQVDMSSIVAHFVKHLELIKINRIPAEVEVSHKRHIGKIDSAPIMPYTRYKQGKWRYVGLQVDPIYRYSNDEKVFPILLKTFRRRLSPALKRLFFRFTHDFTSETPPSYQALGKKLLVNAAWQIDEQLTAIDDSFDFLLGVTPINLKKAWRFFRRSRFTSTPSFRYRPLQIDPALVKRKLYKIPIERIEDPTLEMIFSEKRLELDRQLTMLSDRGTNRFLFGSMQLFGKFSDELVQKADYILRYLKPGRSRKGQAIQLSAQSVYEEAQAEIAYYKAISPHFQGKVQIRDDIYTGLMVQKGNLLIGKDTKISHKRLEGLLSHEIGTHSVTYFNGRAQPFKLLSVGLAGYDELQEGLAVLSEYLVGQLSISRLRLLAARVKAAKFMIDGASFVDVFHILNKEYKFNQTQSFTITARIFRAGGFVKDAVYLRGFLRLIKYVVEGKNLDLLYVGKISERHIPFVQELMWRKILYPIPLMPKFLSTEKSTDRLNQIRANAADFESLLRVIIQ